MKKDITEDLFLQKNPHCKQVESCSRSLSGKCICPKPSCTKGVIDLAMQEVSKDVRLPKAVREGKIKMDTTITKAERDFMYYYMDRAGSFTMSLFDAIQKADSVNQAKLSLGFPEEVRVAQRFRSEEGYFEDLQRRFNA